MAKSKEHDDHSLLYTLSIYLSHFLTVFVISAGILYVSGLSLVASSPELRNQLVFLNWLNFPIFANLSAPEKYGLVNTENLFLNGSQGKIGAWFVKPVIKEDTDVPPTYFLYLHGNCGNRAVKHRVQLLKKLQDRGKHVLAIDYSGFGDSAGRPSEEGLISDAHVALKWLQNKSGKNRVFMWGHSLGSGVAVGLAKRLSKETHLSGVILEAPFSSIQDAAIYNLLALPLRLLPKHVFDDFFLQELKAAFRSDIGIKEIKCPIFIVHDREDETIPVFLAEKLCNLAKATNKNVVCQILDEKLYHKYIFKSETFFKALWNFIHFDRTNPA